MDTVNLPLLRRLGNTPIAYVAYLKKMLWPSGLAIYYPLPGFLPVPQLLIALGVLAAISITALLLARRFDSYIEGFAVHPSAATYVAVEPVTAL